MRSIDFVKAYTATRLNGWDHQSGLKAAGVVFSSGGFGGLVNQEWWPNTFRKLSDPWFVRAGFDGRGIGTPEFQRNSVAQACLAWIQRNFIAARVMVQEGEGNDAEEIEDHAFTSLLARPNPRYSAHWLWALTIADWWQNGRGNAYWLKERDGAGKPLHLWHIPAQEMRPDWDRSLGASGPDAFVNGYVRTVNGKTTPYRYQDIVHFRCFSGDPANLRQGWSPLMAGQSEIGILNEGALYRGSILVNHGVPSYALTPADKEQSEALSPGAAEAVEKVFVSKFTGRNRGAGLFIPNFLANLTRIGFSPQELDIRQMMEWDCDMICALFGLNSMVLGLPSGEGQRTYSNQSDAREAATRENIMPTQAMFAGDLELQLLPDFDKDPGHHVGWDYSNVGVLQEDQNALRESIKVQVAAGIWSRNEGRVKQGLESFRDEGSVRTTTNDDGEQVEISDYDVPAPLLQTGFALPSEPGAEPAAPGALPESTGDAAVLNGGEPVALGNGKQPALPAGGGNGRAAGG